MGLFSKLKEQAKGLTGLGGSKAFKEELGGSFTPLSNESLKDKIKGSAPGKSIDRLQSGNIAGFLADPSGIAGSKILDSKITAKLADPGNLTGSRPGADPITGLTIEELLAQRIPEATGLLEAGAESAIELSRAGQQAATEGLDQFGDLRAFQEQQALLGTSGEAAQEAAIGNIPISQFDQQLQARQRERQLRQASARNELGSGSTILGAQQLGGAQIAETISKRLSQLEPLVGIARSARSTQSTIDEAARTRQAQLQTGLGTQKANIKLGTTAPLIESRLSQAELSGLKAIGKADSRGQIVGQLAELAGQFASSTPPPQSDPFFNQQSGFGNIGDPFASSTPPPRQQFGR